MTGHKPLILIQTDFGEADGGILHLFGVCKSVWPDAQVYSLRNDIPKFDVLEAARSLKNALSCWPKETVFVSAVVDPEFKPQYSLCVAKNSAQQYIVAPGNGTISGAVGRQNIEWIRDLSGLRHRYIELAKTEVCHGRDIVYCAAHVAKQIPEVTVGTLLFKNGSVE